MYLLSNSWMKEGYEVLTKLSNWIYGIAGMVIGFLLIDSVRFRRNVSKEYVLKDDFIRIMEENRQDHRTIFSKLDAIRDKLEEKADKDR